MKIQYLIIVIFIFLMMKEIHSLFSNCTFIKCAFSGNFADAKGISQDILEANIGAKDKIVLPKSLKIPMKWPRRLDLPSFWEWTESGKVREGKGNVDYM